MQWRLDAQVPSRRLAAVRPAIGRCALANPATAIALLGILTRMRHRLCLTLLLVCLVWQGIAMASWVTLDAASQAEHALVHWQASSHHHHEDGATHLDDSNESVAHTHADHGYSSTFLLAGEPFPTTVHRPIAPATSNSVTAPKPFLEGPLRPPRFTV